MLPAWVQLTGRCCFMMRATKPSTTMPLANTPLAIILALGPRRPPPPKQVSDCRGLLTETGTWSEGVEKQEVSVRALDEVQGC
jgi:hypothetical protein